MGLACGYAQGMDGGKEQAAAPSLLAGRGAGLDGQAWGGKAGLWQLRLRSAEDALRVAKANDIEGALDLESAKERVKLAKKNISAFLPEVDFSFNDTAAADKRNGDYKQKSIEAGVTQRLFNGGKDWIERKIEMEKSLYEFLEVQKKQERKEALVLNAYYTALFALLKARVLEGAAQNAEDVLLIAELEKEEGLISEADFLESQARCKKMGADKKAAQNDFTKALRDLLDLMRADFRQEVLFEEAAAQGEALFGQPGIARTKGGRPGAAPLKARLTELTQMALENSLDLKKAKAQSAWLYKQRLLSARAFLPSVSVRAGVSFNGSSYPLTEPTYSIKVILGFDDNPWLPLKASKSLSYKDGALNSIADSVSGKGKFDATYFGKMRLEKIALEKSKAAAESARRTVESQALNLVQSIESAEESAALAFEALALKERKLALSKIELEQGSMTKSDYLKELNDLAGDKIKCLETKIKAELLVRELESLCSCKLRNEEES